MKKKILFVLPNLTIGGITTSFNNIYNSLRHNNFEIFVFTITGDTHAEVPFNDIILKKNTILDLSFLSISKAKGLRKILAIFFRLIKCILSVLTIDIDSLILYYTARNIDKKIGDFDFIVAFAEGITTSFVQYFSNPNKVAWIHCDYVYAYPYSINDIKLYSKYKSIVFVSNYTAKCFISRYPSLKNKIISIYNIIDLNRIKLLANDVVDKEFCNAIFKIVSIGRIAKVKQYSQIPKLASKLLAKKCIFKWYIIGPNMDYEEYRLLQENIAKYDVSDSVVVLGAKVNPYSYLKHSNLLVCLSISEACPMIFNEAKVLNVPIVSTNFGSSREFVEDGVNGLISPLVSISDKIFELYENSELYKSFREFNCDFESYNTRIVEQIKSVFNK